MKSKERIQKIIAHYGICSRRRAEELIDSGQIKINGKITTKLGTKINPEQDKIEINLKSLPKDRINKIIKRNTPRIKINGNTAIIKPGEKEKEFVYIAVNKPVGYITSTTSKQGKSVLDLITEENFLSKKGYNLPPRIYPVGRLDKDSKGLVLLTNDGDLTNKLTHPSFEHEKEYQVKVNRLPKEKELKQLQQGMNLKDQKVKGVKIKDIRKTGKDFLLTLVLTEGKNRQIRRMFDQLGYKIEELKRTRVSNLYLGHLPAGRWKFVQKKDII